MHYMGRLHHHFGGQHSHQLPDLSDVRQLSAWPHKIGGHSRLRLSDDEIDFRAFGSRVGSDFVSRGSGSRRIYRDDSEREPDSENFNSRYWSPQPIRQRNVLNDESIGDHDCSYGISPSHKILPVSGVESDNIRHSLLSGSVRRRTAESGRHTGSHSALSTVPRRPIFRTLVSVSDKPQAVRSTA